MRKATLRLTLVAAALAMGGCAVGPDYKRPAPELPVAWTLEAPWRTGTPADAADKGAWWQAFGDAQLDALEAQAMKDSPTLAIAAARLAQARATVTATSAGLFPSLSLQSKDQRFRISANRPLANYASPNFSTVQNDFTLGVGASYEVDLAGRVSRSVEGAKASAEQSAADLANTRLVVSAELASDWFSLVTLDASLDVLDRSIALQRKALGFVNSRHELGAGTGLEVAQQQALLDNTLTQVDVQKRQRAQFEHAIATLVGAPAPTFSLPPVKRDLQPPPIPVGVPSDLLQRRPDIAAAERHVAVANANIGVARAAYFPSLTLSANGSQGATRLGDLFNASSFAWSLGVSLAETIFDGGARTARVDEARASWKQSVAQYRQTVLSAFSAVEDQLSAASSLEQQQALRKLASQAADQTEQEMQNRYKAGLVAYTDVVTAQASALSARRALMQVSLNRQTAAIGMVAALGGGWSTQQLAKD